MDKRVFEGLRVILVFLEFLGKGVLKGFGDF